MALFEPEFSEVVFLGVDKHLVFLENVFESIFVYTVYRRGRLLLHLSSVWIFLSVALDSTVEISQPDDRIPCRVHMLYSFIILRRPVLAIK